MVVARKYNPGFLSDDEIVASFCVRTNEFESIMEMLRECRGASNTHQIVIGPRGSGKTTLLLRVAAEVRRAAGLAESFFPIVFAEESYEVATAGEFWLECLGRLAVQAPQGDGAPDLHRTYDELRTIRDDRSLADRSLGALLDFSDREGRRLVLMAENLNTMFREMADEDAGWRLRKILQTEPRIILLASATSRFDQMDNPDNALYELFRVVPLRPLDAGECAVLWETVTGQGARLGTIRALRILVGGSPRLFVLLARFGAGLSFRRLMADLLDLVDDHTEYFRSHLEMLAPQERRVYLALADLWKPATTGEIADGARLETSKCSAQLARLVERQLVRVAGGTARRKQYYLTERLYNIYHLLRRPRGSDRLVKSLVHFMTSYYSPRELQEIGTGIVHATDSGDGEMRQMEWVALTQLVNIPTLGKRREELLAMIPSELSEDLGLAIRPVGEPMRELTGARPDSPDVESLAVDDVDASAVLLGRDRLERGRTHWKLKRPEEALSACDEVVRRYGENEALAFREIVAEALVDKGAMLAGLNRLEEALATCDDVERRYGYSQAPTLLQAVAKALFNKGIALDGLNRPEEALVAYGDVVKRFEANEASGFLEVVACALTNKGMTLDELNRREEALATYCEVERRFGDEDVPVVVEHVAKALTNKVTTLTALNRPEEALSACSEIVQRYGTSQTPFLVEMVAISQLNKVNPLQALNRLEEALSVCDGIVRRYGKIQTPKMLEIVARALVNKAVALRHLDRLDEALTACDNVIDRFSTNEMPVVVEAVASALCDKGAVLGVLNRPEEAIVAFDEVVSRYEMKKLPSLRQIVARALVNKAIAHHSLGQPKGALAILDKVVSRYGTNAEPNSPDVVADALLNRGLALAALSRPHEALTALDEVVRRFGGSDIPDVLKHVSTALLHTGVHFVTLDQTEQALETFEEVVRRYGDNEVPSIRKSVASAILNKGAVLVGLNRLEEALAEYREVVRRFGTGEASVFHEPVARALGRMGAILEDLNRPNDALTAFDELVHRFGESESPALGQMVAGAFGSMGITLRDLNRPKEALAAFDELVHRFGESESPALRHIVAGALVDKGITLVSLDQLEDAIASYGEVVRRFGEQTTHPLPELVEHSLLAKAHLELNSQRYESAIRTADALLKQRLTDSPQRRIRSHLVRARATLAVGDIPKCEHSIEGLLMLLPELDSIPGEPIHALMEFSLELGPDRVLELIQTSPASDLLLPLSTALEQELGLEPRVAQEVEQVAHDIRQELGKLRDAP